jgi:hypothetical protein
MSKTQIKGRDPEPKLPLFKLTSAGLDFCSAYGRLGTADRQTVEDLLLQHAFLPAGTNSYLWWGKWNKLDMMVCHLKLRFISQEICDAWYVWASEISKTRPSRLACREAILGLLSNLVHRKFVEEQANSITPQVLTIP